MKYFSKRLFYSINAIFIIINNIKNIYNTTFGQIDYIAILTTSTYISGDTYSTSDAG